MRTLLLDMDGVLVDFVPHWLNYLNLFQGIDIKPEEVTKYALHETHAGQKALDGRPKSILNTPFTTPGFFRTAPMMPGAREFIRALQDFDPEDFQFFIVTHPSGGDSAKEKYEWVEGTFGPNINIIMTKHKYLIGGDMLVDDCVEYVHKFLAHGKKRKALIPFTTYLPNELKRFGMNAHGPQHNTLGDPTSRGGITDTTSPEHFFNRVLESVNDMVYTVRPSRFDGTSTP